jgi:hypothetical protein
MKLPEVIAARTSQFFTVPAVSVARARNVIQQMPADEVAAAAVGPRNSSGVNMAGSGWAEALYL